MRGEREVNKVIRGKAAHTTWEDVKEATKSNPKMFSARTQIVRAPVSWSPPGPGAIRFGWQVVS